MGKLTTILRKKSGQYIINSRGESLVYIRYSHKSQEVFFSTEVLCIPEKFDSTTGKINSLRGLNKAIIDSNELKILKKNDVVNNKKISQIKSRLDDLINDVTYNGVDPATKYIKNFYSKGYSARPSFWQKFHEYDVYRKSNDKKNTYRQVPTLKKCIKEFESELGYEIDFENLSLPILKQFKTYLTIQKKYSVNTVGYIIKALKTFLNTCISEGIKLKFSLKDLKKPVEIKSIIFLTEEELLKLYNFSYEFSRHRKVVDLFTLQSFTGFRISDLKRLNSTHINQGEIVMHQSIKTDRPMSIPMVGPVENILKKYCNKPPVISESNYNKYIKEAAKLAIPDAEIEIVKLVNNQKQNYNEKKCSLITTHVAIKTFVTMFYNRGVSIETLAYRTGKSVEVIRRHYLHFSSDNASDEIRNAFLKN